jgi:hypothetical protein
MMATRRGRRRCETLSTIAVAVAASSRALSCLLALVLLLAVTLRATGQPKPTTAAGVSTNLPALKPTESVAHARISRWKPIFRGVEMCEGSSKVPRALQVHAVRINLKDPTIDFLVTPRLNDGSGAFGGRTTSEFLTEFKCQIALNASVFDVLAKKRGDPMHVEDLSLSRGDLYLSSNKWDALLISTNHRAWIARAPVDTTGAYNGFSGFYALLINGKNNGTMKNLHPRSAAGISRNGRYLILMTIDGRQPGYSEGTSTAETAEWMRKLGGYNALNLDGGGSTALVIEGEDGSPVVLSRPCGPPVGTQRRVANHLGVFAQRLASAPPPRK